MNLMNYLNRKPKIIEFHLLDFNGDMKTAWCCILEIYKTILTKDAYWHFFYEGSYSIIRCNKKYYKNIKKYLEDNAIKYKYLGLWIDGSVSVEEHKQRFIPIFHEYSMLSMELEEENIVSVADRICHCFFNHCTYMAENHRIRYGTNMWEGILMGQIAVQRAHYIGKLDQDKVWENSIDRKAKKKEEEVE